MRARRKPPPSQEGCALTESSTTSARPSSSRPTLTTAPQLTQMAPQRPTTTGTTTPIMGCFSGTTFCVGTHSLDTRKRTNPRGQPADSGGRKSRRPDEPLSLNLMVGSHASTTTGFSQATRHQRFPNAPGGASPISPAMALSTSAGRPRTTRSPTIYPMRVEQRMKVLRRPKRKRKRWPAPPRPQGARHRR